MGESDTVADWNFSKQYAELWREDEQKLMMCVYNKDFRGAGNILLMSISRYPPWVYIKDDTNLLDFYGEYINDIIKYEEHQQYTMPGSERQLILTEAKINKQIVAVRTKFHKLLDEADVLLKKKRGHNEEDEKELAVLYAQGR